MSSPEDPRRRLLEAAGQIFAEKGFEGATVREIKDRAGVNIAAVNYYFQSKERLYIEAVKNASCGSLDHSPLPAWPPGTSPTVKLREFIGVMVGRLMNRDKPAWHTRLMMREMAQPTSACAEWVRDYVRPNAEVLTGILEELLPPGTPPFKRYLTGFSIMGQCLHYMQNKPVIQLLMGDEYAQITPEAVAAHVTEFSLAALGLKALRPKTAHSARGKS
jgi:TetR/AcrR family transcriptional regulator, regulator of cefoperazone and chloramphenicol sensitivity